MTTPKEGDLKVWWIPQVPMYPFEVPVSSVKIGAVLLNTLAEYDAFQLINKVKPDYCNMGGLMVFEGGDWADWWCEDTFETEPDVIYPQPSLGYCANLPA